MNYLWTDSGKCRHAPQGQVPRPLDRYLIRSPKQQRRYDELRKHWEQEMRVRLAAEKRRDSMHVVP